MKNIKFFRTWLGTPSGDCQFHFVSLSEVGGAENPWFKGGGEEGSQDIQGKATNMTQIFWHSSNMVEEVLF